MKLLTFALLFLSLLLACGPNVDKSTEEGQLAKVFLDKGGKHHDPQAEFASILDHLEANTTARSRNNGSPRRDVTRKEAAEMVHRAYSVIEKERPGHTDLLRVAEAIRDRCPSGQRGDNDLQGIAIGYGMEVSGLRKQREAEEKAWRKSL